MRWLRAEISRLSSVRAKRTLIGEASTLIEAALPSISFSSRSDGRFSDRPISGRIAPLSMAWPFTILTSAGC